MVLLLPQAALGRLVLRNHEGIVVLRQGPQIQVKNSCWGCAQLSAANRLGKGQCRCGAASAPLASWAAALPPLLTLQCGPMACRKRRRPAGSTCSTCSVWVASCSTKGGGWGLGGGGRLQVCSGSAEETGADGHASNARPPLLFVSRPPHRRACPARSAPHPQHQQQLPPQVHPLAAAQLHKVATQGVAVQQHAAVQLHLLDGRGGVGWGDGVRAGWGWGAGGRGRTGRRPN